MTIATDFTRDDCIIGKRRLTYATLQRDYRCAECGGRLTMKWSEPCESYPQGWHVECGQCGSHDFIHERQLQRQKADAIEVLDGLPPELARALK
jgi:DNA-directed RNA polymerase subunit RPC12/RpoP